MRDLLCKNRKPNQIICSGKGYVWHAAILTKRTKLFTFIVTIWLRNSFEEIHRSAIKLRETPDEELYSKVAGKRRLILLTIVLAIKGKKLNPTSLYINGIGFIGCLFIDRLDNICIEAKQET